MLDRIAENGSINTEELRELGYDHPPRARMDAIDLGFPIKTTRVKSTTGRNIAAYSFDLERGVDAGKAGRLGLPKREREKIIDSAHRRCQLCGAKHDLQVDHRVPYQIAGESLKGEADAYMVLDGSCNRRKSWACEHCQNFTELKDVETCQRCYWASPEEHKHVAMQPLRRLDLTWENAEVTAFDRFQELCKGKGLTPAEAIKQMLASRK